MQTAKIAELRAAIPHVAAPAPAEVSKARFVLGTGRAFFTGFALGALVFGAAIAVVYAERAGMLQIERDRATLAGLVCEAQSLGGLLQQGAPEYPQLRGR